MSATGKKFASESPTVLVAVHLNALPPRSHHKTPLDCWREVDAFKSAVAVEEQVRL